MSFVVLFSSMRCTPATCSDFIWSLKARGARHSARHFFLRVCDVTKYMPPSYGSLGQSLEAVAFIPALACLFEWLPQGRANHTKNIAQPPRPKSRDPGHKLCSRHAITGQHAGQLAGEEIGLQEDARA